MNDNRKHLISCLMVASFATASPAVALQIPGLKNLPGAKQVQPAAPVATPAPPPTPVAPPPPLLPGEVGKDFAQCMKNANASLAKGLYQMALDNYRAAKGFKPEEPAVHLGIGWSLHGMGQEDAAIEEFFEALRLKPDYGQARFGLGTIMMKRESWDEAAGQFMQIIKVAPQDLATRGQLGLCYEHKGQVDSALEQFKYIVQVDPKNVDAHYNLGVAYDLKEDWRNAVAEYAAAIKYSNDKHTLAYVGLGNCLLNLRQPSKAIVAAKEAIRLEPKNYYAYILLGRAYELSKNEDEAYKNYNRAIQLAPKAPECQKLMQNMLKTRAKKLGLNNLPGLN